jgi:hypothetical protein
MKCTIVAALDQRRRSGRRRANRAEGRQIFVKSRYLFRF